MIQHLLMTLASIGLVFAVGCKKTTDLQGGNENHLVNSSRAYFENEILSSSPGDFDVMSTNKENRDPGKWRSKTPSWDKAAVISISAGEAVLVPVQFIEPYLIKNNLSGQTVYSSDHVTKLLIYKDGRGDFNAEQLTFFPDSNYVNVNGHPFTGIISIDSWAGTPLKRFKFSQDGTTEKYALPAIQLNSLGDRKANERNIITICYESSGYNYAVGDPSHGYFWTSALGCQSYFLVDPNNSWGDHNLPAVDYGITGAGGTPTGMGATKPFSVIGAPDPVINVGQYMKCFTNSPGYGNVYTVTLCVQQPIPGSRETWGMTGDGSSASGSPVAVGHAFLILSQTNAVGSTVRNVGFYPEVSVTPISPRSHGQINNDAYHNYNISVSVTMDNSQFFKVVNYLNLWTESSTTYDLNTNNCTTFALNALANAGINIPRTTGTWLNGGGLNPGDLGEDIRTMQLSSNMTRTTLTGTHANMGICY